MTAADDKICGVFLDFGIKQGLIFYVKSSAGRCLLADDRRFTKDNKVVKCGLRVKTSGSIQTPVTKM